jgi:hypothetical protein
LLLGVIQCDGFEERHFLKCLSDFCSVLLQRSHFASITSSQLPNNQEYTMTSTNNTPMRPMPLYAVAMSDAIASGDVNAMIAARDAAFDHLAAAQDVTRLLPALESALKAKGAVIRPLYAVTIQDTLARGNAAEIANLKAELASYASLLDAQAKTPSPMVPYGVAIQDAKARGDSAEVARLTALAQSLLAQLNAAG